MKLFCFLALSGLTLTDTALGLSECAGEVRFDNEAPGDDRVIADFVVSARDAIFGMSYVSAMKVVGGPNLEAVRYESCQTPWPDGSHVETICRLPASISYSHFPPYLGIVREGNRTQPGHAEVYFLEEPRFVGRPIGSIYCEAF